MPDYALVYDVRIVVQAGSKVEAEERGKDLEQVLKDRLSVPGPISQSDVKLYGSNSYRLVGTLRYAKAASPFLHS